MRKAITKTALEAIVAEHRKWLISDGREGVRAVLPNRDLSGLDLAEINLAFADLTECRFSGANLLLADFTQAHLRRADLSGADLSGADLLLADFSDADLSGADLSVSDLSGATLSGAWLTGAALPQSDLSGTNLSGADLSGADLSGAQLSRANLSGANLAQARLSHADLTGANLSGANLLLVSAYSATLRETNLTGVMVDSLTLAQFPAELVARYRESFQVLELDRAGEFTSVRELEFPLRYQQAGLSLIAFFAGLLARRYSPEEIRIRLEIKAEAVVLSVETAGREIKDKVEEALEIYGLIVKGALVPAALSDDPVQVRRLEAQLRQVRSQLAADQAALQGVPPEEAELDRDMDWLRAHVSQLLQHSGRAAVEATETGGVQAFQSALKGLMDRAPAARPHLAALFQKFNVRRPSPRDAREMDGHLKAIRESEPAVFDRIAEAFAQTGMAAGRSPWASLLSDALDRSGGTDQTG
ncbi:MAG: pentapeptide repeat-containing protein [Desulfococcaceae bacterium]